MFVFFLFFCKWAKAALCTLAGHAATPMAQARPV
jgi:hypothetical protein